MIGFLSNILIKIATKETLERLFFWAARQVVSSTKTDKDDKFYEAVEAIYKERK